MPNDVEMQRDLVRAYWSGKPVLCPKHPGSTMTGSFVQTTFADHVFLTCSAGQETIQIQQRPKQIEFQDQQVEGFVENLQRNDAILCYRCQSKIETSSKANPETGISDYTFTCIRCFSWGRWVGKPELAKIGK